MAALDPITGLFKLTIEGARRCLSLMEERRLWVRVDESVVPFIERGGDVFTKHVVDAHEEIRPGEEVFVINSRGEVIAVGRAILSGYEMKAFKRGVAVKVRRGRCEK